MVYSAADALALAQKEPQRQVVFFAIGFETTTPPTALVIRQAAQLGLTNFSVLCCHVLTRRRSPRSSNPRGARAGHGAAGRLHRPGPRAP
jgi:hydrogenase maturation factor